MDVVMLVAVLSAEDERDRLEARLGTLELILLGFSMYAVYRTDMPSSFLKIIQYESQYVSYFACAKS
jgi:hypothetical protein